MTDEEIHNIYLHMSGKAEGIAEVTETADFPVLFARAILKFNRMEHEWVGLTDAERNQLWRDVIKWGDPSHDDVDLMKAIEAKLKEKNA